MISFALTISMGDKTASHPSTFKNVEARVDAVILISNRIRSTALA